MLLLLLLLLLRRQRWLRPQTRAVLDAAAPGRTITGGTADLLVRAAMAVRAARTCIWGTGALCLRDMRRMRGVACQPPHTLRHRGAVPWVKISAVRCGLTGGEVAPHVS